MRVLHHGLARRCARATASSSTTARRVPAAGELFVLWDGDGLVVKRVEPAHEPGAPKLRLLSANPAYPPYTCLAADVHIVGKVLWKVTRA